LIAKKLRCLSQFITTKVRGATAAQILHALWLLSSTMAAKSKEETKATFVFHFVDDLAMDSDKTPWRAVQK
jgi:hypothetical protein